jgi:putative transposase
MTAPSSVDPDHLLHEQLAQASPDLLRQMLKTFIHTLMSAEADAVCDADYGARSQSRINVRNGYRPREFDTRAARWHHPGGGPGASEPGDRAG